MLRDAIYRTMMPPWVARISCLVIFIVLMAGVRFVMNAALEGYGRTGLAVVVAILIATSMWVAIREERRR